MIYIGSDHRGYELKKELIGFLKANRVAVTDTGPKKKNPRDDFPVYVAKVAGVVSKKPKSNKGILICGSGQGVCIAANKFKNIRAALCWNEDVAKQSRNDDDTNILCIPSDFVSAETAEHILEIWLNTPFSKEKRFLRRLKEISEFEK